MNFRDALDQAKSISTGHIELSQLVIYLTMDCTGKVIINIIITVVLVIIRQVLLNCFY